MRGSDAVAALMSFAGLQGAIFNVEINLKSIKEEAFVSRIREQKEQICAEAERLRNQVWETVRDRLEV